MKDNVITDTKNYYVFVLGYDSLVKFIENNKEEIETDLSKYYFNGSKVELC